MLFDNGIIFLSQHLIHLWVARYTLLLLKNILKMYYEQSNNNINYKPLKFLTIALLWFTEQCVMCQLLCYRSDLDLLKILKQYYKASILISTFQMSPRKTEN
jgi:hypothetical protein